MEIQANLANNNLDKFRKTDYAFSRFIQVSAIENEGWNMVVLNFWNILNCMTVLSYSIL